VTLVIIIIIKN